MYANIIEKPRLREVRKGAQGHKVPGFEPVLALTNPHIFYSAPHHPFLQLPLHFQLSPLCDFWVSHWLAFALLVQICFSWSIHSLTSFLFHPCPSCRHLSDLVPQGPSLGGRFGVYKRSWVPSASAVPALSLNLAWSGSCHPGVLLSSEESRCPENQLEGRVKLRAQGPQSGKKAAAGLAELAFLTFVERGRP